jgi:hypothetical protein
LSTAVLLFLAAIGAASLQTFAISAPENPGVWLRQNQSFHFFSKEQGEL